MKKISKITRLKRVMNLFDENVITENFQYFYNTIPSYTISKSAFPLNLSVTKKEIPKTFEYEGETVNIMNYLDKYKTSGFLVMYDGAIVYENYWHGYTKDTLTVSWSMLKSIISVLVGIALKEGFIKNINDKVSEYEPLLIKGGYKDVTIKQVLQMTSGVKFDEDYQRFFSDINKMGRVIALGRSINRFAASLKPERKPGTFNRYCSMDTQVLGMVLQKAVNMPLHKYLESRLWQPMGMENDSKWLMDNKGMELAFGVFFASLRDYGKIGLIFANLGTYNNIELVPKSWVLDSTIPDTPFLMPGKNPQSPYREGYGYQWWIPEFAEDDFVAKGVYGQSIYVSPKRKTVIVRTSVDPNWSVDCPSIPMTDIMCQTIARHLNR